MGVNGIYGLSGSGLDIESMVKVGMMSKQNEYDKMAQKYTKNEWTKNALIDLNNQITTFNLSSLTDYKLKSNMNARTAESSNETSVTATANANAAIMSHKVSVKDLSHNAYLIGANRIENIIKDTQGITADAAKTLANEAKLSDILFKNLEYGSNKITSTYTNGVANKSGGIETIKYSGGAITDTTITRNSAGNVTSVEYNGVTGEKKTANSGISEEVTYTRQEKKATLSMDCGDNLTVYSTVETKDGVTKTTAASFTYNGKTYSATNDSGFTSNSSNVTFTDVDDPSSTLTVNIGTVSSTSGVRSITIPGEGGWGGDATYNVVSGTTTTTETYTESTITFNGNEKIYATTTRAGGSTATITATTARTEAYEEGVTGKTLANNGERKDIGWNYDVGKLPMVQKDDIALSFTIADKENADNVIEISYKYEDILDGKSMNDLISDITTQANNKGINIKASYDNINGVFSIYNPDGNDESRVIIEAVDNNQKDDGTRTYEGRVTMGFLNALQLSSFNGERLEDAQAISAHQGGTFKAEGSTGTIVVDGMEYKTKDNKVTVGGVTYNALSSTKDVSGTDKPATVTVGQDVDAIVDRVKSFVESYNKILGSLYEKYDEKADSNYKPLTQSQKDQMKDEQIEKWEEKAKQGLLYHDQTLSKIINQMRNAISLEVEGIDSKYKSAYSIGIETTGLKGQLKFNEDKLRNALAEDGDAVSKIFTKLDTEAKPNASGIVKENGIAQRLGDILTNATKLIKNRAGSSTDIVEDSELNNLLRELQTKMSNFKKMMNAFEDRLYKKYDAMEVALSKLGTQLNFITGGQ